MILVVKSLQYILPHSPFLTLKIVFGKAKRILTSMCPLHLGKQKPIAIKENEQGGTIKARCAIY